MSTIKKKPSLFIQASAIGYYGNRPSGECSEMCNSGDGFLAEVCNKWESNVPAFEELVERTITLRIGLVLGKYDGVFPELMKQSKRHMAGVMGSGKQWMSWIHIYDLVYATLYLINDEKAKGVYNMVAPKPHTQKEFSAMLKESSGAGFQLSSPAFLLRTLLGEFGKELLLNGQKVSAAKLIRQGFLFRFSEAGSAIEDILDPYSH